MNPGLGQGWQAFEDTLHIIQAAVQVGGAQRLGEVGVDTVHAECLATLFVNANQQAIFFLAAVKVVTRIADDRHAIIECLQFGQGVGEEIHVLHRRHRVVDAEHVTDLVDAITGRVDDFFTGDITVLAVHDKFAVGLARDAFDRVEAVNLGTGGARLARQREGDAGRIDIAVERIPPGAAQTVGVHQRVTSAHFGGVDELHFDAHAGGHADVMFIGVDLLGGMREAHAAGDVVGNRVFRIGGEFAIQIDAVALERDHGLVGAELSHLRRGVPGRTRGQFVAFQQHHVIPAFAREMVEGRAAGDAAADDDHACLRFD